MSLLDVGSGATSGLEVLLARMRADEALKQRDKALAEESRSNQSREQIQREELEQQRGARADAQKTADARTAIEQTRVSNEQAARQSDENRANLSLLPMSGISGRTVQSMTAGPGGLPSDVFQPKPVMEPAPPASLAAPGMSVLPMTGTIENAPLPAEDRTFTRSQTLPERTAAAMEGSRESSLNEKIREATDRAQQAWDKLRMEGDSQANRLALAKAASELAEFKAKTEREKADAAAAKTPQPQFFQDENSKWHAVIFDKGAFTEVPLPKGFVPTKPSAEDRGIFSRLLGAFKSSDTSDPNDPSNWPVVKR